MIRDLNGMEMRFKWNGDEISCDFLFPVACPIHKGSLPRFSC